MRGPRPDSRSPSRQEKVTEWLRRAPRVPPEWFVLPERATGVHGAGHVRRVCVHALRINEALELPDRECRMALTAALWHDIGRRDDGVEPEHGAGSVQRVRALGLADAVLADGRLSPADLELVLFAVHYHSLNDEAARRAAAGLGGMAGGPRRRLTEAPRRRPTDALRLLWVLKDADALDRVRIGFGGDLDPGYFRYPCTTALVAFAWQLYAALPA
jgi:hypothetical protein